MIPKYEATIFIGRRVGYTDEIRSLHTIEAICQEYCNKAGLCVTVTETKFIYTNGSEPGAIIGLINYPRFPTDRVELSKHARLLGMKLKEALGQKRVTLHLPDGTIMLGDP